MTSEKQFLFYSRNFMASTVAEIVARSTKVSEYKQDCLSIQGRSRTNTINRHVGPTVCLQIGICEVRTPGRPATNKCPHVPAAP